jgi:hypothetical protein
LFFFASEQHLTLMHSLKPLPWKGLIFKNLLMWLHQLTRGSGVYSAPIEVVLSPTAQIIGWSEEATLAFGFCQDDVLGKLATDCFIPVVETSGRELTDLIHNICLFPREYGLNLNENQHQEGSRYWVLWVNVPIHNQAGEIVKIWCRGTKIEDPIFMRPLITYWLFFQRTLKRCNAIFSCYSAMLVSLSPVVF